MNEFHEDIIEQLEEILNQSIVTELDDIKKSLFDVLWNFGSMYPIGFAWTTRGAKYLPTRFYEENTWDANEWQEANGWTTVDLPSHYNYNSTIHDLRARKRFVWYYFRPRKEPSTQMTEEDRKSFDEWLGNIPSHWKQNILSKIKRVEELETELKEADKYKLVNKKWNEVFTHEPEVTEFGLMCNPYQCVFRARVCG